MRCWLLLVLVVPWLRGATNSHEGIQYYIGEMIMRVFFISYDVTPSCPFESTIHDLGPCHKLQFHHTMRTNCGDNVELECANQYNCTISYGDKCYEGDWKKEKVLIQCECEECTSKPGAISEEILGALVGLLLMLLVIVTTVLVWTCWLQRKRGQMNFNAEHQLR